MTSVSQMADPRDTAAGSTRPMNGFLVVARLDMAESIRARWFYLYSAAFVGIMVLFIVMGLAESRVMGFTGLSRLLVSFIQITMAILPLFVLVTTSRSLVGDREAGNLEYLLSLPVSLAGWYWGKFLSRLVMAVAPILLVLMGAVVYGAVLGLEIPWVQVLVYGGLVISFVICFVGMAFFLSSWGRSTEMVLGFALVLWLTLIAFLDLALIGLMIRSNFTPDFVVSVALANPLQTFRTAAMMLFDNQLVLLGPSAYVILDRFGTWGFIVWALAYPIVLGMVFAGLGFWRFRSSDIV